MVDGGINKLSKNISEIISGHDFLIYREKGYKNFWTAGCNKHGQFATNTFQPTEYVECDGTHPLNFFADKGINNKKICTNANSYTDEL